MATGKDGDGGGSDNARLVEGDVEARVRELKAQDGEDMVILASGTLTSSFLSLGLVDELHIVVVPVVLGGGKPLFHGIDERVTLGLSEAKPYPKGSVHLVYTVKG